MKCYPFCMAVLVLTGLAAATLEAAEPIKRGVSPQDAAKLDQIAAAYIAKSTSERLRARQQAIQATHDQLKSEREAFAAAIEKQPEYGQMKRELDDLTARAKAAGAKQTQQQHDELRRHFSAWAAKYQPAMQRAYQQARIDDNRVRSVISNNFARYLGRVNLTKRGLGWSVVQAAPTEEPPPEPPPTEAVFEPPYSNEYSFKISTSGGLSLEPEFGHWDVYVNKDDGRVVVELTCFAADGLFAKGYVGNYFRVPPGTHQVRVIANIRASHHIAAGYWAGYSAAGAELNIVLAPGDGSTPTVHVMTLDEALQFVFVEMTGDIQEYEVTKTFTLQGGSYLFAAGGTAHVTAAGPTLSISELNTTVNQISVEIVE